MTDKLDRIIREINKRGCLIGSINQVELDRWIVSIRKEGRFSTGTGAGSTLLEALEDAWLQYADGDAWNKKRVKRRKQAAPPTAAASRIRVKIN